MTNQIVIEAENKKPVAVSRKLYDMCRYIVMQQSRVPSGKRRRLASTLTVTRHDVVDFEIVEGGEVM